MDGSLPGSSVHGLLQERILEKIPGDFPDLGIEPRSSALQADSLPTEPPATGRVVTPPPHPRLQDLEGISRQGASTRYNSGKPKAKEENIKVQKTS